MAHFLENSGISNLPAFAPLDKCNYLITRQLPGSYFLTKKRNMYTKHIFRNIFWKGQYFNKKPIRNTSEKKTMGSQLLHPTRNGNPLGLPGAADVCFFFHVGHNHRQRFEGWPPDVPWASGRLSWNTHAVCWGEMGGLEAYHQFHRH